MLVLAGHPYYAVPTAATTVHRGRLPPGRDRRGAGGVPHLLLALLTPAP